MISKLDKNFTIKTSIKENDIVFRNVKESPFNIYGLKKPLDGEKFMRMDGKVAEEVSEGVSQLNYHTAGGRVRFKTNSNYVALSMTADGAAQMSHMPLSGSTGFDMYVDNVFYKSFIPPFDMNGGFEGLQYFNGNTMRDIIINFPLYNGVNELYIGLQKTAKLEEGSQYKLKKPILFYGSSITQGGCASRPGNCYSAIISRKLDCDYINLGFSGNAKGEKRMAEYISDLSISAFVMDYDHNAPSAEHLKETHEKFLLIIREKQKDLPVIFVSKPDFDLNKQDSRSRRAVIFQTYKNALSRGDKNVYYIDGETLFGKDNRDGCTVDGTHPNDFGFYKMAKVIGNKLKKVLF